MTGTWVPASTPVRVQARGTWPPHTSSTPAHIILVGAGAHCMYPMQYLSTLGSDPWIPVASRRPVAYGWTVEARPSHKSHQSRCDFHLPLKGPVPVPVRPLHQPVPVTQGWSVKSKPPACLCLCLLLLPRFVPSLLCNDLTVYLPTSLPSPCSPCSALLSQAVSLPRLLPTAAYVNPT